MAVITFDATEVLKTVGELSSGPFRRAAVRALNKTAGNVRVAASTAIRQRRALSAKVVRQAMAIKKATKDHLVSGLVVTGRPIPLKEYAARQTKRGVTVRVSPGKRMLVTHAGNRAFLVAKIGGHVFARQGKPRLPIKKLFGPSLPSTFVQDEVRRAWTAAAHDALPKRMAEEVRFELDRLKARAAKRNS
jgi:hypothetical protein